MIRPVVILITDPAYGDDAIVRCVEAAGRALPPGALCVQLRDGRRPPVGLRVFASRLRGVTRAVGASLVVNGEPRVARDVGADGVHLGRGAGGVADARSAFGRRAWVSVAAHSDDDVRRALGDGADAVLVSPVFPTRPPSPLAQAKEARGEAALRSARAIAPAGLLIYALGGVTPDRAPGCLAAGADGFAVIRALLDGVDPAGVARGLAGLVAPITPRAGRCPRPRGRRTPRHRP